MMHTADVAPKTNPHHGSSVDEWFKEEETRDPGFLARIDAQIAMDEEALLARQRWRAAQKAAKKAAGARAVSKKKKKRRMQALQTRKRRVARALQAARTRRRRG